MSASTQVQQLRGTVSRISTTQTIRVSIKVTKVHPLYRKRYSQVKHVIAHDPEGKKKVGEEVTITACRPISKTKHWVVAA